jgi:hypothetical protein
MSSRTPRRLRPWRVVLLLAAFAALFILTAQYSLSAAPAKSVSPAMRDTAFRLSVNELPHVQAQPA